MAALARKKVSHSEAVQRRRQPRPLPILFPSPHLRSQIGSSSTATTSTSTKESSAATAQTAIFHTRAKRANSFIPLYRNDDRLPFNASSAIDSADASPNQANLIISGLASETTAFAPNMSPSSSTLHNGHRTRARNCRRLSSMTEFHSAESSRPLLRNQ